LKSSSNNDWSDWKDENKFEMNLETESQAKSQSSDSSFNSMDDDLPKMFVTKDTDNLAMDEEEENEEDQWITEHSILPTTNTGRTSTHFDLSALREDGRPLMSNHVLLMNMRGSLI
jgi:hypothetical protein